MNQIGVQVFRPTREESSRNIGKIVIIIISEALLIRILISTEIPFGLRLFLSVLAVSAFLGGIYFLAFQFMTRLELSNKGIYYLQPMYFVFSEWQDITGAIYINKGSVYLVFNNNAKVKDSLLERIFINQKTIPLPLFAGKFDKLEYWQKDKVLIELMKYLPYLANEIINAK